MEPDGLPVICSNEGTWNSGSAHDRPTLYTGWFSRSIEGKSSLIPHAVRILVSLQSKEANRYERTNFYTFSPSNRPKKPAGRINSTPIRIRNAMASRYELAPLK